jgi:hypothetical protein
MAAAARSERSFIAYDKAPLARGFVFGWVALRRLAPVAMMPMAVTPAPMTVVPMVAMPMMAPADLLRLQLIDLGLRDQCRLRGLHLRSHELSR